MKKLNQTSKGFEMGIIPIQCGGFCFVLFCFLLIVCFCLVLMIIVTTNKIQSNNLKNKKERTSLVVH